MNRSRKVFPTARIHRVLISPKSEVLSQLIVNIKMIRERSKYRSNEGREDKNLISVDIKMAWI